MAPKLLTDAEVKDYLLSLAFTMAKKGSSSLQGEMEINNKVGIIDVTLTCKSEE